MDKTRLGRTNLMVTRTAFGALPIQRVSFDEARKILRKAYENGINFFDTARAYSDSEEKIAYSLSDVRQNVIIATKSHAGDRETLFKHLEASLKMLKTDYIDIYQLHNPARLPDPNDSDSLYGALLEAKKNGLIRFFGITNHRLNVALEAAASGLYDTVQFPLSFLSSDEDLQLVKACKVNDVGFIAMKALSGGLITNAASSFAYLRQFDNVVPIWGIQKKSELDEFLELDKNPPALDGDILKTIEKDRSELSGDFCRACGYCMPCPAGIQIPTSARMTLLLGRAPYQGFLSDENRDTMELITKCTQCGQCSRRCPYQLDTPSLLKKNLMGYREFYAAKKS